MKVFNACARLNVSLNPPQPYHFYLQYLIKCFITAMYVVELPVSKRTLSAEWKSDITTLLTTNVSFFILITIPQHFMNTLLVRKLRSWTGNIVQHITQITCIVSGFPGNRPALTHHVIRSKTTGKFIYLSKALESTIYCLHNNFFFTPLMVSLVFLTFSAQLVRS